MGLEGFFQAAVCVLLPFFGTAFGSAAVFFLGRKHRPGLHRGLLGFSAGVMLAAMVWSLLQPAIDLAGRRWQPAALGFLLGIGCLLALDSWLSLAEKRPDRGSMLSLAVTLHNLPEGMAVGIALAAALLGTEGVTLRAALLLSVGIAIQNIPEGAIVSLPAQACGRGRGVAFFKGALSGAVEPIGAIFAFLLSELTVGFLPFLLAFAAAAMLSSVVGELSASFVGRSGAWGRVFFAVGFVLMTSLDVLFS